MNKNERRTIYRNATPATSLQLSDAIQKLEALFDFESSTWDYGRDLIPLGAGFKIRDAKYHFGILLTEYRRTRAELLQLRNINSRSLHQLAIEQERPKPRCRKRLQPLVQMLMDI